ncbi:MAG: methyltransferase domain-containing protein [Kiritimatiellia bacterium]
MTALQGDLEGVPLPSGSVDAVFLSQALHHAAEPARAVAEAVRLLRPGGLLLLLDLARHDREWVRERFADQWLGFEPDLLAGWVRQAGGEVLRCETLSGSTPELPVLVLVAVRKPNQPEKGKTKA